MVPEWQIKRIVPVLVAVNILVNMIGITGIAPKLSGLIMSIGGDNLILSLFIATIVPFLLGTSLPVVPTYVLCLSILVPPLLKLGVDEVSAHLFFIYWSLLVGVTPPTCTQAIVAAGIAGGDWVKTGFLSVRLGVVAFIIPYFFVLNPALVGRAPLVNVFITAGTGFVGALALAYSLFGHFRGILAYPSRVLYFAAGLALLYPNRYVSLIGLVVAADELDPDFVINARTDAIAVSGVEDAIKRGNAYAEAGADLIFVEAPRSVEQIKHVIEHIDAPVSINLMDAVVGGKTPLIAIETLRELGVGRISIPVGPLFAAIKGMVNYLDAIKGDHLAEGRTDLVADFGFFKELVGFPKYRELEKEYLPDFIPE